MQIEEMELAKNVFIASHDEDLVCRHLSARRKIALRAVVRGCSYNRPMWRKGTI